MSITHSVGDAQTIDICQKMLANQQELDALVERDPDAPDGGPNNNRHQALLAEFAALAAELIKSATPTTHEGIRALAQAAMLFADHEGNLCPPGSFGHLLQRFALASAAGAARRHDWPD